MSRRAGQAALDGVVTPTPMDELLERSSRTFALTIPMLPEPTRCEVTVAYLLFRVADTLEDANLWSRDKKLAELARLASFLNRPSERGAGELSADWLRDPPCSHSGYLELLRELPAVVRTAASLSVRATDAIRAHTSRTIEGMSSFVARERDGVLQLESIEDLQAYCYAVAGIVGEMLTELFLLRHSELLPLAPVLRRDAPKFGEALQLVNILKDSASDSSEGRRYLPRGIGRSEVFALARGDLETAGRYTAYLEQAAAPRGVVGFNALPMMLAWATLARVERQGPGSKLTRAEVGEIVTRLEGALDRQAVTELWDEMRSTA